MWFEVLLFAQRYNFPGKGRPTCDVVHSFLNSAVCFPPPREVGCARDVV